MASSIKNSTGIDHHARGMNLARDYALRLDLHSTFREDHAVKAAGDDHSISFNLSFDLGILAQDDGLLGNDVSLDVTVDAERSCQR